MGTLTVIFDGSRRTCPADEVVTVGRDPSSTIVVTDPSVSRSHLTIACEEGTWKVTDHSSTGTFHAGRQVDSLVLEGPTTLHLGGRSGVELGLEPEAAAPDADRTHSATAGAPTDAGKPATDAGKPATDAGKPATEAGRQGADAGRQGADAGRLTVICNGSSQTYPADEVVTVGRDPSSTIVVTDPSVSRSHLTIACEEGTWKVTDHSSTGTFHAGRQVDSLVLEGPTTLHLGGRSGVELEIQPPGGARREGPAAAVSGELAVSCGDLHETFRSDQVVTIGRDPASTILLDDPSVSHTHLLVHCERGSWVVNDRSSTGTFRQGKPVTTLVVREPTELHLGGAKGVALRLEPMGTPAPAMPLGGIAPASSSATIGVEFQPFLRGEGAGKMPPLSLLIPVRAWLHSRHWRSGLPFFLLLVWAVPTVLYYSNPFPPTIVSSASAWTWSVYFGFLWAVLFWALVRPGKIPAIMLAEIIIFGVIASFPVAVQLETHLHSNTNNAFVSILTVGLPEEGAKALAVVVVALVLHRKKMLTTRSYMYLGVLSGITFGVVEAHEYLLSYYLKFSQAHLEVPLGVLLLRAITDGIDHGLWAGICGFFIALAVFHRRWLVQLVVVAVALPAILHGLGDYLASTWGWGQAIVIAVSAILFVGYASSGDQIDRVMGRIERERGANAEAAGLTGG